MMVPEIVIVPIYGLCIAGIEIKAPIIRPIRAKKEAELTQRRKSLLVDPASGIIDLLPF